MGKINQDVPPVKQRVTDGTFCATYDGSNSHVDISIEGAAKVNHPTIGDAAVKQQIDDMYAANARMERELSGNTGEFDAAPRQNGGSSGGKGDIFRRIATEMGEFVAAKNEAYGSSFSKTGDFLRLLYPGQITEDQYDDALLMVRIFDKQMRIANKKDAFGEDPYRDIMGYGLCGVVMGIDDEW